MFEVFHNLYYSPSMFKKSIITFLVFFLALNESFIALFLYNLFLNRCLLDISIHLQNNGNTKRFPKTPTNKMVVVARLSIAIAIGIPTFASPNGEMLIKKRSRMSLYTFQN